jgi:hypothetical protein
MGITFAVGMALIVVEYMVARKKKEGITPTDRQRIVGIFWLSVFASVLVGGLIWMTPS